MTNSIIEAISISLNEEFGDGYEIFTEELEQDLKEPCFFIFCLNQKPELFLGKRYFRELPFCIQYFPQSANAQSECNAVGERMWCCLEYITIYGEEKPIRGTKMKYEVVDGVLNFFVNYDNFVIKQEQQTPMETLKESTSLKEGG